MRTFVQDSCNFRSGLRLGLITESCRFLPSFTSRDLGRIHTRQFPWPYEWVPSPVLVTLNMNFICSEKTGNLDGFLLGPTGSLLTYKVPTTPITPSVVYLERVPQCRLRVQDLLKHVTSFRRGPSSTLVHPLNS